jgi:hypothetical protein
LPGKRLIYSGYADDTTVYIFDSKELPNVLSIFEKSSYVSGMGLNVETCTVIPMKVCEMLKTRHPAFINGFQIATIYGAF